MQSLLAPPETDLLNAAFRQHPDAILAWERWRDGVDWDGHLDYTSFALLPLVYRNLVRMGADDPLFPRFKGIIRQAWLANRRLMAQIEPTLAACAQEGIEVLILPPTLRLLHDSSAVLNRNEPLNWAVRAQQAEPALRYLLGTGWRSPEVRLPRWSLAGYTLGARQLLLRHDRNPPLMLTWGLDWWFGERLDTVWSNAGHQRWGRQPVRSLDVADALAFELRRFGQPASFQRIAELLLIANHERPDWRRLNDALHNGPPMRDRYAALILLQPFFEQWGGPPDLPSWSAASPADSPPRPQASLPRRFRTDWNVYRTALGDHHGHAAAVMQLPGYLIGRWRLSGIGSLPKHLMRWFSPNFRSGQP